MKISIILPVYNKAKYIKHILNDISNQSFDDFECIIVDDGSTDDSGIICDNYSKNDVHFKIIHISNGGVSHARNVGLDEAIGEYITFIDADDRITHDYLQRLYDCLMLNHVDIVIGGYTRIWEDGKQERVNLPYNGKYDFNDIILDFAKVQKETGIYGFCFAKLLSRHVIGKQRFNERIKLAEDLDFYIRIYQNIKNIYFDIKPIYYYLQMADNSSQIIDDYNIDYYTQLNIQLKIQKFLKDKNSFVGDNEKILKQNIQGYTFACLFYCNLNNLSKQYNRLVELDKKENIVFNDNFGNVIQKIILKLFRNRQLFLIRIVLICYRSLRKVAYMLKIKKVRL